MAAGVASGLSYTRAAAQPTTTEIAGIVGEGGADDFVAFGGGERHEFAADELGDLIGVGLEHFDAGGGAAVGVLGGFDVDDEVVFVEPFFRGLDEDGAEAVEAGAQEIFGGLLDFGGVHPAIGLDAEGIEIAFEFCGEFDVDDAEPVVFDSSFEFFAGGERDRAYGFDDGGVLLRLRVFGAAVGEGWGARGGFGAEDDAQFFHFDGFGDVEEAEDAEETLQDHWREAALRKSAANTT